MSTATAGTTDRILDTAERLFGERGFAGTSLRALTDAAHVNVAAVNYHFGSKEELLRAVVRRAMEPVNDDRQRVLTEMQATNAAPSVEDLVRAFVTGGANLVQRHGDRGRHVARFIGRVICEPEPTIRQLFATEVSPVEGQFLAALEAALPQLSGDDVAFRYTAMVGVLALHQAGTLADMRPHQPSGDEGRSDDHQPDDGPPDDDGPPNHDGARTDDDTERLVTMLTGLFWTPPAGHPT